MYPNHLNDLDQLTAGLYGGVVVVEPGQAFDPTGDHLFVAGWDGFDGDPPGPPLVNGDSLPPRSAQGGIRHRFRFVNIGPADPMSFRISRHVAGNLAGGRQGRRRHSGPPAEEHPARFSFDVGRPSTRKWSSLRGRNGWWRRGIRSIHSTSAADCAVKLFGYCWGRAVLGPGVCRAVLFAPESAAHRGGKRFLEKVSCCFRWSPSRSLGVFWLPTRPAGSLPGLRWR